MAEAAAIIKELSHITHEFNNILNTLNGYNELAIEAKNCENAEEYDFYKEKIVTTLGKKLPVARGLTEQLNRLQIQLNENA